jgi:4-hydroxy-4-methyl-2-oxoglutarate aldolase
MTPRREGVPADIPPTSTISDALGRLNTFGSALARRTSGPLAGRAFCVELIPGDSATSHLAIEHAPDGAVLVIAGGGFRDRAVWGEILTAAAQSRGVVGAVIDGAVRDVSAIEARGFPLFSVAVTPTGPHKAGGGRWGGTVACAGAVVATGDLVVGDDDGLVVVPAARADEAIVRAREIVERERRVLAAVERGESTADLLGLRAQPDH